MFILHYYYASFARKKGTFHKAVFLSEWKILKSFCQYLKIKEILVVHMYSYTHIHIYTHFLILMSANICVLCNIFCVPVKLIKLIVDNEAYLND